MKAQEIKIQRKDIMKLIRESSDIRKQIISHASPDIIDDQYHSLTESKDQLMSRLNSSSLKSLKCQNSITELQNEINHIITDMANKGNRILNERNEIQNEIANIEIFNKQFNRILSIPNLDNENDYENDNVYSDYLEMLKEREVISRQNELRVLQEESVNNRRHIKFNYDSLKEPGLNILNIFKYFWAIFLENDPSNSILHELSLTDIMFLDLHVYDKVNKGNVPSILLATSPRILANFREVEEEYVSPINFINLLSKGDFIKPHEIIVLGGLFYKENIEQICFKEMLDSLSNKSFGSN